MDIGYCKHCGHLIIDDLKTCPICGNAVKLDENISNRKVGEISIYKKLSVAVVVLFLMSLIPVAVSLIIPESSPFCIIYDSSSMNSVSNERINAGRGMALYNGKFGNGKILISSLAIHSINGALPGITKVTFPIRLSSINGVSLPDCESLGVSEGNNTFDSRDECNAIIQKSNGKLVLGCNSSRIPKGTSEIGASAFVNCTQLVSVVFPESLSVVGSDAFKNCSNLSSIEILGELSKIGDRAFAGCTKLNQAFLPDQFMDRTDEIFCLPVDLSERERANCYIVPKGGSYCFSAKYEGNSLDEIKGAKKVAVIWETFNSDIEPEVGDLISKVELSDGYIYFSTNKKYKEGNALIAVLDDKECVLWSWHLWFTSSDLSSDGEMMNRNLGAITQNKKESYGFYYQWGRKDPLFIMFSFSGRSSNNKTYFRYAATGKQDFVNSGNLKSTISHPTTYFVKRSSFGIGWSEEKTKYDPCPPGWRVPSGGENRNQAFKSYIAIDAEKSNTEYPYAGCISTIFGDVDRGNYWTCSKDNHMELRFTSNGPEVNFRPLGNDIYLNEGYSIRPMRDYRNKHIEHGYDTLKEEAYIESAKQDNLLIPDNNKEVKNYETIDDNIVLDFLKKVFPNEINFMGDDQNELFTTARFRKYSREECDYDPVYVTQDCYAADVLPEPRFEKFVDKNGAYIVTWKRYEREEEVRNIVLLGLENGELKIDNILIENEGTLSLLFDYSKPPESIWAY